jgi:serine protease Do
MCHTLAQEDVLRNKEFIFSIDKPQQMPPDLPADAAPAPKILPVDSPWRAVQKKVKDTVVQVFVYTAQYNWFEPYKSPSQGRTRGSGFFIDDDGHIVSNYHVVNDAVNIKIQIPSLGKERFDVKIVGVGPERDIALLKLTDDSYEKIKKQLGQIPFLKFGNSDKVVRTQEILSLGYPLGQEKLKSTQGIVSGRERLGRESYIQITAALNPGNSGGPSLNRDGRVIGINTSAITRAQNVGYIIPINDVQSVLKQLFKEKLARRPFLGVELNYANDAMVEYLGNPEPGGVYVSRVFDNTVFDKFGIEEGDMLYQINGHTLDRFGETSVSWSEDKVSLIDLVNRFEVGQDLRVVIYRNGKRKEFNGILTLNDPLPIRRIYPMFEEVDYEIIGGMIVMELRLNHILPLMAKRKDFIKYIRYENQSDSKLLVTHVFPNSTTHLSRVVGAGDIITHVNGKEVTTLDEFRDAARTSIGKQFVSFKTEEYEFMVLSIKDIIDEEGQIAALYFFKPSSLVGELRKDFNKKREGGVLRV